MRTYSRCSDGRSSTLYVLCRLIMMCVRNGNGLVYRYVDVFEKLTLAASLVSGMFVYIVTLGHALIGKR